ncbi:hypothetical protein PAESOLCIP111_05520 [Paenibacillus solanacearum]|uniref:Cytochrome c oxidase subunit 2A n=1 Tax=Paenibacillus solanacearum TaxID=2048548 RepID=A0A916K9F4_9BACL|nr:hypothetical protein PAESOLCIP111_05520 [Paenibacillus solanacearum]
MSGKQEKKIIEAGRGSRIGTWLSLSVVGAVILLTYLVLFGLYMSRV